MGWAETSRLSLPAYAAFFVMQFIEQWLPALAPRSLFQWAMLVVPVLTILVASAGVVLSLRKITAEKTAAADVLIVAGACAFTLTFACHLIFSYERHLATGWLMDAYPRYYLAIAPFVPLACLSVVSALSSERKRTTALLFLIIGPIAFRVLGAPL